MDPPRCCPPSATGRIRPAHAQHTGHHRDAAARPLRRHRPEPVLRQRLLTKKAAAFLGNPFSLPGSLMRLLAPPGSFCPPVLAWVTFPVLPCLMTQSLGVLPLAPSSAAHSLMLFFGSASRAFLQCPAASGRHSSACCLGAFALALDPAFPVSPALTDISLLRSAGGDGRATYLSISAAGSCRPAVHQKITAQVAKLVGSQAEPPRFHDLRHTFATMAIGSGVDVKTVSAILGHSNAAMTLNVYADALADSKKVSMDLMGRIMSAGLS